MIDDNDPHHHHHHNSSTASSASSSSDRSSEMRTEEEDRNDETQATGTNTETTTTTETAVVEENQQSGRGANNSNSSTSSSYATADTVTENQHPEVHPTGQEESRASEGRSINPRRFRSASLGAQPTEDAAAEAGELFVKQISNDAISASGGDWIWLELAAAPRAPVEVEFLYRLLQRKAEEVLVRDKILLVRTPAFPEVGLDEGDEKPTAENNGEQQAQLVLRTADLQFLSLAIRILPSPSALEARTARKALFAFAATSEPRELVAALGGYIHLTDADGNTLLHETARRAQSFALRTLLTAVTSQEERRKLVAARNANGRTALHEAVQAGDPDSVHYLLATGGASPAETDRHGNTVYHILAAVSSEAVHKEVLEWRGESSGSDEPSPLDTLNDDGLSPLHLAIRRLRLSLVEQILDAGAGVDVPDGRGKTALLHAVDMNDHEIVSLLIAKQATIDVEDGAGQTTPLLAAAHEASWHICGLLLDAGASPSFRTKSSHLSFEQLAERDDTIREIVGGRRFPAPVSELVGGGGGNPSPQPQENGETLATRTSSQPPPTILVENGELDERLEHDPRPGPSWEEDGQDDGSENGQRPWRAKAFRKDDVGQLDYLTRLRLSKVLDGSGAWRRLAERLDCQHMIELIEICAQQDNSSPTMLLLDQFEQLNEARISRVAEALADIDEFALKLLNERIVY